MAQVYYAQDFKYMLPGSFDAERIPKNDFVRLPFEFDDKSPDDIFKLLNSNKNPLSSRENQKWLEENFWGNAHTSMANGDVIEYKNRLVMLTLRGWADASWKK